MVTEAPEVITPNIDDELFRVELLVAQRADLFAQTAEHTPNADLKSWEQAEAEILGVAHHFDRPTVPRFDRERAG